MPTSQRILDRLKSPFASSGPESRSERPLRILIAASLIFPAVLFAVAAVISYRAHFDEARDRLERTLGMVHEHANKVFDTFEISERYLEELFEGKSDAEIRDDEEFFSIRLRRLIDQFPQLRDLWVIGGDGKPLVSGTVMPMPRNLDLSDRDYFHAHKTSDVQTYVGDVVDARAANTKFFAITRKRLSPDGNFAGVYLVSIAPEYFVDFYSRLPSAATSFAQLLRPDGAILARFPEIVLPSQRLQPGSTVMTAIRRDPAAGFTRGVSSLDGIERIFAYRRLSKYDVYVVAGLETRQIRQTWMESMAGHLVFGIPATLAMFALSMMALSRTRHDARTQAQLNEETARHHATELALQQAQKMEAVGQLTGGVAHDFNNLLTIIGGNLDTIRRRLLHAQSSPELEGLVKSLMQPLERAIAGSQSAAQLTHRLLAFSRRQALKPERLDLNHLVADISELLRRTLGESINIETVLAGGLWPTFADRNQLENALLNLAINARDAMPHGGRLTIETANAYLDEAYARGFDDLVAGQYVVICVTDTGTGMSPEVIEKVFEPFFTTKGAGKGSGLGLAMVHGFVKQSGGHVRVYSELGQGTTVKIYLPRISKADQAVSVPAGTSVEPPGPSAAVVGETILLVEDNEDVRDYATSALEELGYNVLSAADAEEALSIADRTPRIDILFTDVVLPGDLNGRQLANRLLERRPGLPVLFTTGYTRNAIIHHGRLDSDVHLLSKPYAQKDLALKLRELLDSRKQSAS